MKKGIKRHWKKVLLGLFAVVLVVGGYLLYQFQFKEYDVADEEVEKITDEDYTIELPDGTSIGGDNDEASADEEDSDSEAGEGASASGESGAGSASGADGEATDDGTDKIVSTEGTPGGAGSAAVAGVSQTASENQGSGNSSGSKSGTSAGAGSGGSTGSGSTDSTQPSGSKPTVAAIKNKYAPSFESLQSQAHGKINSLVGRAKAEYSEKKSNGESISYGYFYQKYMGAAASLEGQTDAVFNQLIGAVESELQKNGYSKEYAQSFRDQYQAEKESMRSSIISSAMNR
ncbi:hypothetical protein M3557_04790 [Bhargavaea ginsengi]|uniref:hypothetical protein n=1 Tax=Bhargavaea ginsengi TaxID=426757 RepID=UPI00203AD252|nr:hypothetical protein [Bhargavaea ginsengi]MCM3087224.1 hypothetical protein [Bhargavaea ginsengi]